MGRPGAPKKEYSMRNNRPDKGPLFVQMLISIFVLVFAVFWTTLAASGAGFMAIFGVFFIVIAVARMVMLWRHAMGKDRKDFSASHGEEQFDRFDRGTDSQEEPRSTTSSAYCPYCGAKVGADFTFCGECGRKLK